MNPVAILQKVEQISSTHNEHFTNFRIFVHSNEIRNLMMKCNDMNPKQFLQIGGVVLIVVGLLGFFGLIGPTAESSIFGSAWWFDNGENWAHTILGVVALIAAGALKSDAAKKNLVLVVGIVGEAFGLRVAIGGAAVLLVLIVLVLGLTWKPVGKLLAGEDREPALTPVRGS